MTRLSHPLPDLSPAPSPVETYLSSERISPRLLRILVERAEPDAPDYQAQALSPRQLADLRALLCEVIPQDGADPIDLAARLDAMMAEKEGNGWRYEALPTDPNAYHKGLDALHEVATGAGAESFATLSSADRVALLERAEKGELESGVLDAKAMTLWFEEVRSDAVRLYVAHPRTLARMGYSGVRNGGPGGAGFTGFARIGIGEREDFEPASLRSESVR